DLDGDARAPTADWLCHRMQAGPECLRRLRRLALPSSSSAAAGDARAAGATTLAYEPCGSGPCMFAVARGRKLSAFVVDGLTDAPPRRCTDSADPPDASSRPGTDAPTLPHSQRDADWAHIHFPAQCDTLRRPLSNPPPIDAVFAPAAPALAGRGIYGLPHAP